MSVPTVINHHDIREFYESHPGATNQELVAHLVNHNICDKCPKKDENAGGLCLKCDVSGEFAEHKAVCVSKTFDTCDGCKTAMQALDHICAIVDNEGMGWYEDMRLVINHIEHLHEQIKFMSNDYHGEQVKVG